MKCTFIVDYNEYCLKLERSKQKESQLAIVFYMYYNLHVFK